MNYKKKNKVYYFNIYIVPAYNFYEKSDSASKFIDSASKLKESENNKMDSLKHDEINTTGIIINK